MSVVSNDIELELFDLAPSQIAEWYAYQLDPANPLYNISFNHYFFKGVNVDAFIQAWQIILDRHECFRLVFSDDGRPKQFLGEKIELRKQDVLIDYTHLSFDKVEAEQNFQAKKFALKTFNFSVGPLFHLHLIAYPNEEHQLIFTIHHIIWDETSTVVLMAEFVEVYNSLLEKRQPNLKPLKFRFLDYVSEESKKLNEGDYDVHKEYWMKLFTTIPHPLQLPSDFTRPPIQTYSGDTVSKWIPKAVIYQAKSYLYQNRCTLFAFFMTIVSMYLYRATGQRDFSIGCPIAGRDSKYGDTLGCFAVPIVLRPQIEDAMTFADLLDTIKNQVISGLEHYHYPCHKVIENHAFEKDLTRPKLFSVMAGVQNEKPEVSSLSLKQGELFFKPVYAAETHGARFDLAIGLDPIGSDIKLFCSYNTDLFRRETVESALESIEALIEQVLIDPHQPVNEYSLLSRAMRDRILNNFSVSKAYCFTEKNVVSHFYSSAEQHKALPAVMFGGDVYSYADLLGEVSKLNYYLIALGVKPGDKIVVILEPSFDMIVALLSILSVGACYIPIHHDTPEARLLEIISLTDPNLVLSNSSLKNLTPDGQNRKLVYVDEVSSQPCAGKKFSLPDIKEESLAYLMFTSGSTGKPKGIPIKHSSLENLLQVTQQDYSLLPGDRILFSTSFSFDASLLEIFWPLVFGATVVIPQQGFSKDPEKILMFLSKMKVSIFQTTPILLNALVLTRLSKMQINLECLRLIICGSEKMTRRVRDVAMQAFQCRLMNHYGPTEVTVDALTFDCSDSFSGDVVPLGRPIANTRVFILDDCDRLVPIGLPGNIVIASPGLTDGYWLDEGKSANAFFVSSDFQIDGSSTCFYRTGDIGKFDGNGMIHFMGRKDDQVRINGNRVELGDIESQLLQSPFIAKAAAHFDNSNEISNRLEVCVELSAKAINVFSAKGVRYSQFTLSQMPWLERVMNKAHYATWPKYFSGSVALKKYWPKLYQNFPGYQFAIFDSEENVTCVANGIPLYWSGDAEDAPKSWDAGLALAFSQHEKGIQPNTVLGLSGIVVPEYQGLGLSACLVKGFRALAKMHGLNYFLGPVRPVGMLSYPDFNVHEWAKEVNENGEPRDFWLRTHLRLGAKLLGACKQAQLVEGSLDQWSDWLSMSLPNQAEYRHATTLQPIQIDYENNVASYYDPTIWVYHSNLESELGVSSCIDLKWLRRYCLDHLPSYMCPQHLEIAAHMPLSANGKLDRSQLRLKDFVINASAVAPATARQAEIVECWKNVLHLDGIGINHDFFELGGQSLQAIQMLSLLEKRLSVHISLRQFYQHADIASLDTLIAELVEVSADAPTIFQPDFY